MVNIPATRMIAQSIKRRLPAISVVKSDRRLVWSHPMRGVSITSGMVSRLTQDELEAVVLHECAHLWGYHSLILAGIRVAMLVSLGLAVSVSVAWFIACAALVLLHIACRELMETGCDRFVHEHGYGKEMFTAHTKVDPHAGSDFPWTHR